MTDWSKIVCGEELRAAATERGTSTETIKKVKEKDVLAWEQKGWTAKWNKRHKEATMTREKRASVVFENRVWSVFYKMGFTHLNASNDFKIEMEGNSKQIDVLAMDDETCLLIECKTTHTFENTTNFKQELESINGYKAKVCEEITKQYGPKKIKFLFATENYLITDDSADKKRMDAFGIYYMNDDTLSYYSQLTGILGYSARYQLLGNLFRGEKIDGLDNKVPSLRGVMGGVTYYSFLIEPERLLKISYILHRNEANHLLMPTYQRLIKKDRLTEVREYVSKEGNFFPNSIIISFNADEDCFTPSDPNDSGKTVLGTLSLPQSYRSAFVIDGQHRLYGYSESEKGAIDVIPVVAFANMAPKKQVSMFMDINEHQKSVSKSLRNTLNIDINWDSEDKAKKYEAIMLKTAESLGEEQPLYGRIVTGENNKTVRRCITTDYIKDAIAATSFLNSYDKSGGLATHGTIDRDNSDKTFEDLKNYLILCFKDIASYCDDEWNKGSEGFLSINNSTYALIRVFDDITNITLEQEGLKYITDISAIHEKCQPLLLDLCDAINAMTPEYRDTIKRHKGGSAKKDSWRDFQLALNAKNPEFINDDLQKFIIEKCTDYNPEAEDYLRLIQNYLRDKFKAELEKNVNWMTEKAPENFGPEMASKVAAGNFKKAAHGETQDLTVWDYISFDEIRRIAMHSSNWTTFAASLLERPSVKNKTAAGTWLKDLSGYQSKVVNGGHIIPSELAQIKEIVEDFALVSNDSNN